MSEKLTKAITDIVLLLLLLLLLSWIVYNQHFCFSRQVVKELVAIFPVLRDWIAEFLQGNKCMYASDIGLNMLIEQVRNISLL